VTDAQWCERLAQGCYVEVPDREKNLPMVALLIALVMSVCLSVRLSVRACN